MPTARLRAQCTDFKTSPGPLPKHWELLLPLCGHTGYMAGAASPGHAVQPVGGQPLLLQSPRIKNGSIAFPFLSQWILDSVAAVTKPSPCLPKHTLELHTEGGRKSLVYVHGSVFSDVSASFDENVEARQNIEAQFNVCVYCALLSLVIFCCFCCGHSPATGTISVLMAWAQNISLCFLVIELVEQEFKCLWDMDDIKVALCCCTLLKS